MADVAQIPAEDAHWEQDWLSRTIESEEFRIYSEQALERKIRRERQRMPAPDDVGLPVEAVEYLLLAHLREMMAVPGLTRLERRAVILEASGWQRSHAASILRVGRGRYSRLLASARRKAESYQGNPYSGWYEVYLSEVRRYVYCGGR